jgi:hypothetical protein
MWIYWGQSIIIGIFNWRRILDLKQFSTRGFRINDRPVQPTRQKSVSRNPVILIIVPVLIFLFNHGFSYRYNRERDRSGTPNIGTIMFSPYVRIIPMHLTILFGSQFANDSGSKLLLFLGLKTVADVVMHMVKHANAETQGVAI